MCLQLNKQLITKITNHPKKVHIEHVNYTILMFRHTGITVVLKAQYFLLWIVVSYWLLATSPVLISSTIYKRKNHFYEMKGDVGMSVHEKERKQEDAYTKTQTHS